VYFDQCLKEHYKTLRIEDCWTNYFAVSTNLSSGELKIHQKGELWRAIRASASIPGLLPPVITEQGELLVDGGIVDNVPLDTIKSLKHGPNLVICFEPRHQNHASINYQSLPGRRQLLLQTLRKKMATAGEEMPKIGSVLTQCMLLNNSSVSEISEQDMVMKLPLPKDIKLNDWHRHEEISEMGYQLGKQWLEKHQESPILQRFRLQSSTN
ncbi:MAG: patatin-like phospholipase family protein, partial [bacterium]